jgi:AcrR family transcriptional regulator
MKEFMTNVVRKTDPRVVRTRQMLRDALTKLILDRGYDSITIQDITDTAGLRRATFYLHYKDKDELLTTMLRDSFDALVSEMEALHIQICTLESEYIEFSTILRHAEQNAALYRSILLGQGAASILRFVREYLIATALQHFNNMNLKSEMPLEMLATYMATLKLNMVTWWLDEGMPYGIEKMAEMCAKLAMEGMGKSLQEAVMVA